MAEPKRLDSAPASEAGRDGRTEALLVEGLDCYFSGRYEDAIHLWTRVLFLDRAHARARAYIDRARTALAERQRLGDEMLQASQDLLDQGHTDAARHLLSEAVAASGDDERASALRVRLERVERIERADAASRTLHRTPSHDGVVVPGWTWPRRSRGLAVFGVSALGVVVVVALSSQTVRDLVGLGVPPAGLTTAGRPVPLAVLSSADVALLRARHLYSRGRLADALLALDRVGPDSTVRREADSLRVDIQQLLLASGRDRAAVTRGSTPR